MTQIEQEQITRIYNTLLLISTKGEDTIIMADCLRAISSMLQAPAKEMSESAIA